VYHKTWRKWKRPVKIAIHMRSFKAVPIFMGSNSALPRQNDNDKISIYRSRTFGHQPATIPPEPLPDHNYGSLGSRIPETNFQLDREISSSPYFIFLPDSLEFYYA
jgi:hypothetical protein